MNEPRFKGLWKQMKGKAKVKWGKLIDDDLLTVGGRMDQLAGKIQERYGIDKEEAERQLDQFTKEHAPGSDTDRNPAPARSATKREQGPPERGRSDSAG